MTWDKEHLGAWLLQLRTDAGMSQERLGEKVGRSRQQISEYEKGIRDPSGTVLLNVLDALGLPLQPAQSEEHLLAQLVESQERLAGLWAEYRELVGPRSDRPRSRRQGQ